MQRIGALVIGNRARSADVPGDDREVTTCHLLGPSSPPRSRGMALSSTFGFRARNGRCRCGEGARTVLVVAADDPSQGESFARQDS